MGHRKEEELNGHHYSGDDTSDDEGHSLQRPAREEGTPRKESHDETSSSSSSSSTNTSHHDGDNGAQAPGEEEEVVSSVGRDAAEDNAMVESTVFPVSAGGGMRDAIQETMSTEEEAHEEGTSETRDERGDDESEVSEAPVESTVIPATIDEQHAGEETTSTEEGSSETCDECEDGESEVSDAPVYDKFFVETSLEEDQKTLDRQESGNNYNVVISETVDGIHSASEKHDAPRAPAAEIVVPKEIAEPEKSEALAAERSAHEDSLENEESTVSEEEEREISDAVEGEAHAHLSEAVEGNGNGIHEAHEGGKGVVEEESSTAGEFEANGVALEGETGAFDLTPEESRQDVVEKEAIENSSTVDEFEANGIALEGGTAATDLTPEESGELESKSGQDNGGRQSMRGQRELSVELGSPLDHQKRYMRQFMTPSPPKRESSVYKIVMALEGLQVGEKCIHGEIDHGTCHLRYGDRRMSSSPSSFSARVHRETSTSPKEGDDATPGRAEPGAEVKVNNEEKTEVDSDWSFVQHDSQSGVTTQQSSTVKTETYTDTVVFRRDDGFLPRTPGRSPLSGSQSMRAVFNQADASGSTTPRLKIVHEFPAEKTDAASASVEGESEVERILRLQETHDLVCPVCRSCITKRVILRKRKRTTVISTDEQWLKEPVQDSDSEENVTEDPNNVQGGGGTVVEQYEDYGCLGCFTFLFRRERNVQRTQAVEVSPTGDAAVSVATITQATDQSAGRLQPEPELVMAPPALTDADYDNRCLPIFFTWRRKTTSPSNAEIVAPLLREEEKDTLSEESKSEEVVQTEARDVPELDDQTRGPSPAAPEMQLAPPASEILALPAALGSEEGVQLPVVVVETREDRLCFPFLWRRASKTTTAQPEILQPLLDKEATTNQSEIDQLSLRDTKEKSVVDEQQSGDVEQPTEDFSRIEDDLWMRREVLLEVPVSVPPQETLPTPESSEAVPESDTSFKTIRVTEAERKVDCLCFPSWSASETTLQETESSRITDSSQVASSGIASSTASKTIVDTSVPSSAEIPLSSPSLKDAVIAPVASSTEEREPQRATLNCMDILIPSYPWGPPGTGSRKEVREEHPGTATSTQFEFSALDKVVNAGIVPEQVASEGPLAKKPQEENFQTAIETIKEYKSQPKEVQGTVNEGSLAKKPQEEIFQTAIGSIKESKSQPTELQGTENELSVMRTEDSRCLPRLLPTISWRRREAKTGEISDQSETGEIKSSVVTLDKKPPTTSFASQSSETKVDSKELIFGDIEVSRSESGQEIIHIHNDFASEHMEEEEVPLVRKAKPLTPSEVKPLTPSEVRPLTPSEVEPLSAEEKPQVVVPLVETDDSSLLPEVVERDFFSQGGVTRTPELPRVDDSPPEENPREKASWNCCLPKSASQDVTVTPSLPPVDVTRDEERREMGSWSCCLPSYTQPASQPTQDRVNGEEAVSGGRDSGESSIHEEVTRETIIDARVTTQTTTTKSHTDATESESIDSIKVDTSVSYVHASVQHDKDAVEGTLHLDDHPTFNLHPAAKSPGAGSALDGEPQVTQPPLEPAYSTGYAALARFLQDEEANDEDVKISLGNEWLADSFRKHVEPLKPLTEVVQDSVDEVPIVSEPEAVTESQVTTVLSESEQISPADAERTQAQVPDLHVDQEEDRSCCLPSSKWRWGRSKLSSEAAHLREPLLGAGYTQSQVSDLILEPQSKVDTAVSTSQQTEETTVTTGVRDPQQPEETTVTTGVRDREGESCSCLPWSGRRSDLEAQLREPLLQQDTASEHLLHRDSEADSKSDSSARVTVEQTHEVTQMTTGPSAERDLPDEERWSCFPWSTRRYAQVSEEVDTTVIVTSDDMRIQVDGSDAASTLAAATAAAEDAGMMDVHSSESPELLKSVVYGGLDVSLASLGVVASAAGGDAKTRNILALGLANLIFGFIAFYYKIQDMHKESPARFQQSVGPRFWINGPLALLSFLFFGSLPVLVFGFSFRELNDYDYKMAATVLASTIAIVFLGCGKVAAKMTELSYRRTLTTLISTGIVAAVAGFYTGGYISKLLAKYGILDE